jgi:sigma-B regulation protein RsbU (phosphoserine phosphatase)
MFGKKVKKGSQAMLGLSETSPSMSRIEALERELRLKQLQINRLLNITQAINNNAPAKILFEMFQSFLSWEIGVRKMALYVRDENQWYCPTSIGIDENLISIDISDELPKYTRMLEHLDEVRHELIGEFDIVVPVRHKDEAIAYVFIGGFSDEDEMLNKVEFIITIINIIAVAIENKRLFKRQLEQERLSKEMELASEVQRMLIPKKLPSNQSYELSGIYKPQLGVGGDYFDYIEFEDGKLVFCVGDISGKGVAAALLMANFQANFHTLINKRTGLEEFVRDLNHSVNLITAGDRFITFFIAEFDPKTRMLRYINAGHNPPLMLSGGESSLLKKGCTILGSFRELPKVETGELCLEKETLIFSFTDGLIDLRNHDGDFLHEQALYDFVQQHLHLPAKEINRCLMEYIEAFKGSQRYPDDFTVLTCKIPAA